MDNVTTKGGATLTKRQSVFPISGYEVTPNTLAAARTSGRALIRMLMRMGDELSPAEVQAIDAIPNLDTASKEAMKTRLKNQKSQVISQLVTADDLGVTAPAAPTDPNLLATWEYFTPELQVQLNALPKWQLATAYTCSIVDLLKGTPFAEGVDEEGKPVIITGVTDSETQKVYSTHTRVYFGFNDDAETAFNTLRNNLLRDIGDGSTLAGANDKEREALVRKLQQMQ